MGSNRDLRRGATYIYRDDLLCISDIARASGRPRPTVHYRLRSADPGDDVTDIIDAESSRKGRDSHIFLYDGRSGCVADLAAEAGRPASTVYRIIAGVPEGSDITALVNAIRPHKGRVAVTYRYLDEELTVALLSRRTGYPEHKIRAAIKNYNSGDTVTDAIKSMILRHAENE